MHYATPYSPSSYAQQPYAPQYAQQAMQVYPPDYAMAYTGQVVNPQVAPTNPSMLSGAYWQQSTLGVPRWALGAGTLALLGIGLAWKNGVFGGGGMTRTTTRSTTRRSARDPQRLTAGRSKKRSSGARKSRPKALTSGSSFGGSPHFASFASGDPARTKTRKTSRKTKRRSTKRRGKKS